MTAPIFGTLPWSPADEHPELLAPVVAEAIAALGLDVWVAAIHPELADTAAFCEAYEVSPDASANCVVVSGRRARPRRWPPVWCWRATVPTSTKSSASTSTSARFRSPTPTPQRG